MPINSGRISSTLPCFLMVPPESRMISSAMRRMRSWCEMMTMELSLMSRCMFSKMRMRFWKLHRSMPASGSSKTLSLV